MRNLDDLLTKAFSQELLDTPPVHVNRRTVRDRTFAKLGLDPSPSLSTAQWAQAVTRKRRVWPAVAAALVLVAAAVAAGVVLRPLLVASAGGAGEAGNAPTAHASSDPGSSETDENFSFWTVSMLEEPLETSQTEESSAASSSAQETASGEHSFDCQIVDATFDTKEWGVALTLEAETGMALDSATAGSDYQWYYELHIQQGNNDIQPAVYMGYTLDALDQWTSVGENTYRNQSLVIPLNPEIQLTQDLFGKFDMRLHLVATDTTYVGADMPKQYVLDIPFSCTLPTLEEAAPPAAGTYLDLDSGTLVYYPNESVFSCHLTVETDLDLDNYYAGDYYSYTATLELGETEGQRLTLTYPGTDIAWTKIAPDLYDCAINFTVSPEMRDTYHLYGTVEAQFTFACQEHVGDATAEWPLEGSGSVQFD